MELALTTTVTPRHHPPSLLHHRRGRPFSKSISFHKTTSFSPLTTTPKSSFRNPNSPNPNPNPKFTKSTNPSPLSSLKSTFIAGITVTAVFLSRFTAIAAPIPPPPPPPAAVESAVETADEQKQQKQQEEEEEEKQQQLEEEKALEDHLCTNPNDTKALKSLMELKIKTGKVQEAVGILNQLINLEPNDSEWELLKNHLHTYDGDHESAKLGFEEIISKDPFRVEAYHGLVMAASAKESVTELKNVEKRITEGLERCKKERKKDEVRDFKLLLAQIRVIEGDYDNALRIYGELSKEEPRDFRPYLCEGIIYTLLGKGDEAEKSFGKYRRLVPKGHPYARYFDDNMVATKLFAEKVENERAYSKS